MTGFFLTKETCQKHIDCGREESRSVRAFQG